MNRNTRLDSLRQRLAKLRDDIAIELEAAEVSEADAAALHSWGVLPADIVRILGRSIDDDRRQSA